MRYCLSAELPPISSIGLSARNAFAMPVTASVVPGPGGHHGAAQPGDARVGVGGVRGHLLVAYVDDLDTLVDTSVIDIDNVAAGNGEDVLDAFLLQHLGDDLAARNHLRSGGGFGFSSGINRGSHMNLLCGLSCTLWILGRENASNERYASGNSSVLSA